MDYRLYFLDHAGHVTRRVDLECDDDEQAVEAARSHAEDMTMELWRRETMIKRFPRDPET